MRHRSSSLASSVGTAALLLRLAVVAADPPTQLFFNFTQARRSWSGEIQLGEVRLYDESGSRIEVGNAQNPGGSNPTPAQGPPSLFDNDLDTKWIDVNYVTNKYAQIYAAPIGNSKIAKCKSTDKLSHHLVDMIERSLGTFHASTPPAPCQTIVFPPPHPTLPPLYFKMRMLH